MSAASLKKKIALLLGAFATFVAFSSLASIASASEFDEYGFESVSAGESTSLAGRHPDIEIGFVLNHHFRGSEPDVAARTESLSVELPPGLVGNPSRFPQCSNARFENGVFENCPADSQVGIVQGFVPGIGPFTEPLFNLEPPHRRGAIARLAFAAVVYQTYIDISVRTGSDYGVTASVHDASGQGPLLSANTIIWGVPTDSSHNTLRMTPLEAILCGSACFVGERASGLQPTPFIDNPTACEEQPIHFTATSYQLPGQVFEAGTSLPPTTGCEELLFRPSLQIEPTNHAAGAPTGLEAVLRIPQTKEVNLPATSAMQAAKVTLPEGMTINSAAANGLEACSEEEVGLGREEESHCPEGAKLGTATLVSPALLEPIHGVIYQRTPTGKNLFRIWLVTDEFGMHLKLPGQIVADQKTGQLTAEFADTPQLPVEEVDLRFKEGPTAPLKNPDQCGKYFASYAFTPWSGNPPAIGKSSFVINEGCNSGGFSPKLEAGVAKPVAGAFSAFVVNLTREDGEDNISSFDLTLPKGQLAKLRGVPLCSEGDAATGNCPPATQVGSVATSAGAGGQPLWIPQPGKAPTAVFLAGGYKGAPYSFVTKVPAQAGPFDLGTVVVRSGLYVNPDTAQATVKTDQLPQILEGIPIYYRTIHASIDRPEFTLAPTSCKEQQVTSTVNATHGAVAHPSNRFQVGECGALNFGPSLRLRLKGGAKRAEYPALTATLQTHNNEANIRKLSVSLPHSEFLAQEHINTICTRVQFSEGNCPKGSIYGRAKAITPLLDQPLEGPVYLRSSNNPLPDMVIALHGQLDINLVGRIDSVNGGIRTTFDAVPDAPVTKFVLQMKGGKKSLLVNSTDLCARTRRATVKMNGQNGRFHNSHPPVSAGCR